MVNNNIFSEDHMQEKKKYIYHGLRRTLGTLIRNFMVLHILRQPLVFPGCVNPVMILHAEDFIEVHFVFYPGVMCSVCFVIE